MHTIATFDEPQITTPRGRDHTTELARIALIEAAMAESDPEWRESLLRFARALPDRTT